MFQKYLGIAGLLLAVAACKGPGKPTALAADSLPATTTPALALPPSTYFNDIARFIAGMPPLPDCSIKHLYLNPDWKTFAATFDSLWGSLEKRRLNRQQAWAKTETDSISQVSPCLFYPFSGADFLNVHLFFPQARQITMIGLEPPGTVPDVKKFASDTMAHYFAKVRKSLFAIMKFSFYRTLAMEKDFRNEELDGTLPNILIFMARNGCHITNINPLILDAAGNATAIQLVDLEKKNYRGIRVSYLNPGDTEARILDYWSADIGNHGLIGDPAYVSYLNKLPVDATYLKSASYLMHKPYFSTIRTLILSKSKAVLQDDSGIPYRFFGVNWNKQLYGTYDKPIKLFGNWYQPDFYKAFQDSVHIKKLGFGIGYDWQEGQSNLMLAIKTGEVKYVEGFDQPKAKSSKIAPELSIKLRRPADSTSKMHKKKADQGLGDTLE